MTRLRAVHAGRWGAYVTAVLYQVGPVPSVVSLVRIFRETGVARQEPRKKPRASYRRLVYPAPNACWQLDGTEYVLTAGRKCVIFQLIDDHSRVAVASHVAWGETAEGAIAVVKKSIEAHGSSSFVRLITRDLPLLK